MGNLFICSKPIQILICSSIAKNKKNNSLVIINNFDKFEKIFSFLKKNNFLSYFKTILLLNDYIEIKKKIQNINYSNIFIEDDRCSKYFLFTKLNRNKMYVFEEGIGTYHFKSYDWLFYKKGTDLPNFINLKSMILFIKWLIYSIIFGSGLEFGKGRLTNGIFLNHPNLYKNNKNKKIYKLEGLSEIFKEISIKYEIKYKDLVKKFLNNKKKLIILDNSYDDFINNNIINKYDLVFVKKHPGSKKINYNKFNIHNRIKIETIPDELLIEPFIYIMLKHNIKIDIYHFSSSLNLYIPKSKKINIINYKYKDTFFTNLSFKRYNNLIKELS